MKPSKKQHFLLFQEDAVAGVHIFGALMVFLCGILYCWVQSIISYKMKSCGLITTNLLTLRLVLTIAVSIFFISCVTSTWHVSKDWIRFHGNNSTFPRRWDPKQPNYINHVVGDVSEWLMALTLLGFMSTFFGEFRFVKMKIVVSRRTHYPVPLATGMGSDDPLGTPLYVWNILGHRFRWNCDTCGHALLCAIFISRFAFQCQSKVCAILENSDSIS